MIELKHMMPQQVFRFVSAYFAQLFVDISDAAVGGELAYIRGLIDQHLVLCKHGLVSLALPDRQDASGYGCQLFEQ